MQALIAILIVALSVAWLATAQAQTQKRIELPRTSLTPDDVAVVINDSDPLSRRVGDYYQKMRHIPQANMIHVRFEPGRSSISKEDFLEIKERIDRNTPAHVQAYAVAWTAPYRVDCMSLTSALAFGFDERY
ncbi:MAG: TIGR03790 family protein, partial [Nitrosospira sp.]|nr:TIGR03790 family protein [Nitrosospira sp.]